MKNKSYNAQMTLIALADQGYFVEFGWTTQNYTHKISQTTYWHLVQPLDRAIVVYGMTAM